MRETTTKKLRPAVLLAALLPMIAGCGAGEEAGTGTGAEIFPVETVEVGYASVAPKLSYSGTVTPARKALLGAQIQGVIERLHVDAGDRVTRGDLLVELASELLTQAEAQYVAAERDWERMKSLLEKGAVTEQAFDHADAAYQAAKASHKMVLESARIRAPFDGVITGRYLDEGEVFTLMPSATGAPAILEIAKMDTVKILIEIAERERPLARKGLPAVVSVDAYPGRVFRGSIGRIDPGLDRMSRTSTADVILGNPGEALRPGMFADVELTLSVREGLLLTRDAIIRQEGTGNFFAYVVEGGRARRRGLTLGEAFGESVEVLEGLEEGDRVVTAGRYKLHDGASVRDAASGSVGSVPASEPGRDEAGGTGGDVGEEAGR